MNFNWFKEPVPLDLEQLKATDEQLYHHYKRGDLRSVRSCFKPEQLPGAIATPIGEMLKPGIEGFLLAGIILTAAITLIIKFI